MNCESDDGNAIGRRMGTFLDEKIWIPVFLAKGGVSRMTHNEEKNCYL